MHPNEPPRFFHTPLRRFVPPVLLLAAVFPTAAPATPGPVAAQRPQPIAPAVVFPADDPKPEPERVSAPAGEVVEVSGGPTDPELPPPCTPTLAAEMPAVPAPAAPNVASAVVYSHEGELYLYDVAADRTARLTDEPDEALRQGRGCWSSEPVFRNAREIMFAADWNRSLYRLDVTAGKLSLVTEPAGGIGGFGLSPDGEWVAYLSADPESGAPIVRAVRVDGTETRNLKVFDGLVGAGRCGGPDDEVSVSWSPDGDTVLVTVTHVMKETGTGDAVELVQAPTMYLLAMDGRILASRIGTHPRWSPDGAAVYFRDFAGDGTWFRLDVDTLKDAPLGMTAKTAEPRVSPGGGSIAHSEPVAGGKVYVFDLMTRTERAVATNHAGPHWLSESELAISDLGTCEECMDGWYEPTGTFRIAAAGGPARRLRMHSTFDASELFG